MLIGKGGKVLLFCVIMVNYCLKHTGRLLPFPTTGNLFLLADCLDGSWRLGRVFLGNVVLGAV